MNKTTDIAVHINDIHKEFILPQSKNTSFKQAAINIVKKNNKVTQKVLDGVTFDIQKGDFFGIVGRNGSGKSTLLKLIAGVYSPTSGSIGVNGGLTPFIELGVGFNPELSGQDNVYLNGALLGFTRKQMDVMYDEIVEFAELGPFMGQKLKNYSSGMQVRLAFSIAIKAKNDILIFDEVLAVGDEAFQRKCLDVFETYKASKQTVILVTHDMETVRQYCSKAVLLHDGHVIEQGSPRKVANKYSALNQASIDNDVEKANRRLPSKLKVTLANQEGKQAASFDVGEDVSIGVDWSLLDQSVTSIGINIFRQSGEHITGVNTLKEKINIDEKTNLKVDFKMDIRPGKYYILAEAFQGVGNRIDSLEDGAPQFSVREHDVRWSGLVDLQHKWRDI